MLINQEAQAKAQKEIDEVTGRTRLPRMSDRNSMPYLTAVVWETFRWSPPVPVSKWKQQYLCVPSDADHSTVALPHRARYADEIDGYSIAKDDVVRLNDSVHNSYADQCMTAVDCEPLV